MLLLCTARICEARVPSDKPCSLVRAGHKKFFYLLIFLQSPEKDNDTITAPEGLIPSLVHAGMLFLPSTKGIVHKAVCCHAWLPFVASCQHDAADMQLTCLTCNPQANWSAKALKRQGYRKRTLFQMLPCRHINKAARDCNGKHELQLVNFQCVLCIAAETLNNCLVPDFQH